MAVDFEKAREWWKKAASQGSLVAQYNLAIFIIRGIGEPANLRKATEVLLSLANHPIKQHSVVMGVKTTLKGMLERFRLPHICKVLNVLGEGDEGIVFLVDVLTKLYAIKLLPNYHQKSKEMLDHEFEQQWNILARLEAPNIIKPLAGFVNRPTDEMMQVFEAQVSEFLKGPDERPHLCQFLLMESHETDLKAKLQQLRSAGDLNWKTIMKYCLEVLQIVAHLYDNQVIHNDMKLDNFLVSRSDHLVLGDFGCAAITQDHHATRKQLKLGNRKYKAPEILNNVAKKVKKIDVKKQYSWEAGFLMFEIAFGRFPFDCEHRWYPIGFGVPIQVAPLDLKLCEAITSMVDEQTATRFFEIVQLLLDNNEGERIHLKVAQDGAGADNRYGKQPLAIRQEKSRNGVG